MARYLMGIDNGGTVAKAAIFTPEGREVAVASSRNDSLSPQPGWVEFDMHRLWQATADAIGRAIATAGISAKDIACAACAGFGNGLFLVDAAGQPVRNAISSSDGRAATISQRWNAEGVAKTVRPKMMQDTWPAQPAALLAWLRAHEPESIRRARWVLMCKDYVRFRLTGAAHAELTDMSGTGLMNVGTADYDRTILDAMGIGEMQEKLPPLCRSADICGQVTAAAAAQTGLAEGTPVAGGLFDIDACGLSSSITEESQLCMILGTWGNNQYIARTPVATEEVFMTSCYAIPGYYLMLEGSATSASNLEWFLSELFATEARLAKEQGKSIYQIIHQAIEETGPGDAGILFLPFLYGSNSHGDASGTILGLANRHRRGHVLRAIFEGVVFSHRIHLERLLRVRSRPQRIRCSGGAARSDLWMQMVADVFQTPVDVPEGSELGAFGAAICAAVAAGIYPTYEAACASMVRFTRSFEPNPAMAAVYEAKFTRYKRLLETLYDAWPELAWKPM